MWNQQKPPSIRELSSRLDARTAAEQALRVEMAQWRDEQRALQRALEAEQTARMDADAALHDRLAGYSHELHTRVNAGVEADNQNHDAIDAVGAALNGLTATVSSLTASLEAALLDVAALRSRIAELEGAEPVGDDALSNVADVEAAGAFQAPATAFASNGIDA